MRIWAILVLVLSLACCVGCSSPRRDYVRISTAYAATLESSTRLLEAGVIDPNDAAAILPYIDAADAALDEAAELLPPEGEQPSEEAARKVQALNAIISAVADRLMAVSTKDLP